MSRNPEDAALPPSVVLVDGEHYPPVILDALASVAADADVVAAVMLGGGEKLSGPLALGDLPIVEGASQREALERGLRVSDDPAVAADDPGDAPDATD